MEQDYFEEECYLKAEKKVKELKGFYIHLFIYLIVSLIWIVILIISNDVPSFSQYGFWAMGYGFWATALFWGIGLFFHWFGVFGKNISFSKKWEDRKFQEFLDKDKNKAH
jgi:cell division protein FtsW (lipid II flippase)